MPSLKLMLKNSPLGEFKLRKGTSLTIGRREDNDAVIDDPAVSGHHAKIDALGGRFLLIDLQSKNGSFVNEQIISSYWLKPGDVIDIGDHSLLFDSHKREPKPRTNSAKYDDTLAMNSPKHRRRMMKSTSHKSINVVRFWDKSQNRGTVTGPDPKTDPPITRNKNEDIRGALTYLAGGDGRIELTRKITTIGTHPTSGIVIKGLLLDPTTAAINKEPSGYYFNYIGGLPKPKINDITPKSATLLNESDIIEIGSTKLQFSCDTSTKS